MKLDACSGAKGQFLKPILILLCNNENINKQKE